MTEAGVLMKGDKVVAGKQAAKFAGRLIAYILGDRLQDPELSTLKDSYENCQLTTERKKPLPPPLF